MQTGKRLKKVRRRLRMSHDDAAFFLIQTRSEHNLCSMYCSPLSNIIIISLLFILSTALDIVASSMLHYTSKVRMLGLIHPLCSPYCLMGVCVCVLWLCMCMCMCIYVYVCVYVCVCTCVLISVNRFFKFFKSSTSRQQIT